MCSCICISALMVCVFVIVSIECHLKDLHFRGRTSVVLVVLRVVTTDLSGKQPTCLLFQISPERQELWGSNPALGAMFSILITHFVTLHTIFSGANDSLERP